MNKNRFNLHRCWSLLIGDLRNNYKDILLLTGVAFFVFITITLFTVFSPAVAVTHMPGLTISAAEVAAIGALGNIGYLIAIAQAVEFSRVFANMSSRSGEISYLMLPATNGEKWLSRVVYVVFVGLVLIPAVYYLAMLCCGLFGRLFNVEALILLPKMVFDNSYFANLFHITMSYHFSLFHYAGVFFFTAAFVLGGTWFRRLPWLYTALILLAALLVFIFIAGFGMVHYLENNTELANAAKAGDIHVVNVFFDAMMPWFYISSIVFGFLGIVMLWLSYILFCRRQLESRKVQSS